ncbi:MAG: hydroxymethylglutaryl-CoA reductase, degradative [Bacteroidales bacterium]
MATLVEGFSKMSRSRKLEWIARQHGLSEKSLNLFETHLHPDSHLQAIYGEVSENTISNFFLPLGLAPNFMINDRLYTLPMVIDESSVVAAASHAAKFWAVNGGFHTRVTGMLKTGQVHFRWDGDPAALTTAFQRIKPALLASLEPLTLNMQQRGGGIREIEIRPAGPALPGIFQLLVTFLTADAMGANFINSILEEMARRLPTLLEEHGARGHATIIMAILSNYTPECLVRCFVEADTGIFDGYDPGNSGKAFARNFKTAVDIALHDPYRAVTHNKGIFNGMDAVIMATGNDYRAVEACGHAYASRKGDYSSLSFVELEGDHFRFELQVPIAVGTVGGLTGTHPLAAASLELLCFPSAEELMQIIAAAGLANNFSAVRSLITTGIQRGHMKMHLGNILRQLNATPEETVLARKRFRDQTISHAAVSAFLNEQRKQHN